jgi:hypothetical protein
MFDFALVQAFEDTVFSSRALVPMGTAIDAICVLKYFMSLRECQRG